MAFDEEELLYSRIELEEMEEELEDDEIIKEVEEIKRRWEEEEWEEELQLLQQYRFWSYSPYGGSPIEKCDENDDLRSCCEKLGGTPIYYMDNTVDCRLCSGETVTIIDLSDDP